MKYTWKSWRTAYRSQWTRTRASRIMCSFWKLHT